MDEIFYKLVSTKSFSNSEHELEMAIAIDELISEFPYFVENNEMKGRYKIENDVLNREIPWALYKASNSTKKTIIFLGHFDTVSNENYNELKDFCLDPEILIQKLKQKKLSKEVTEDLESNEWLFGRGTADMKGGLSVLLNVLNEISAEKEYENNILFVSVPDEETYSKGMRMAVNLLVDLKKDQNLDYELVINSESHIKTEGKSCYYDGTIGKAMLNLVVRGVPSHVRYYFAGSNPILLASKIASKIDGNVSLSDQSLDEVTPPPCVTTFRDTKKNYDVTLAQSVEMSLSYLMFKKSPLDIIGDVKELVKEAVDETDIYLNKQHTKFVELYSGNIQKLNSATRIFDFKELLDYATSIGGQEFIEYYEKERIQINEAIDNMSIPLTNATYNLVNIILDYMDVDFPIVVIALAPPLYPSFNNVDILGPDSNVEKLKNNIIGFCSNELGKEVYFDSYFAGISDMSYLANIYDNSIIESIERNMPLWGESYSVDFRKVKEIQVPVFNIGPWGKDIHKMTERVNKEDLFINCKKIVGFVLKEI